MNLGNTTMIDKIKLIFLSTTFSILLGYTGLAYSQFNSDYAAVPPSSEQSDPPLIMLSMSRDHQYFFKAYNDYTDLDPENPADVDADGNPIVETTYKHSFDYFGYFDSSKCYSHNGDEFVPESVTADKYCTGEWSGNFLNWMSMSRMDIVRAIMYGGKRSTDEDENGRTILERAFLPTDAHSFAKYYNGSDIDQLTPFDAIRTDGHVGDSNIGFDDSDEGITFCNTTYDTGGSSQGSNNPPLIRIAEGNYQLWGANERWQCTWDDERGANGNANAGPTNPAVLPDGTLVNSGIDAFPSDPDRTAPGTVNGQIIARVEVCVDGLIGTENCKQYPDGNFKPIGILQTYGDTGLIDFGLMTGSYANNIEGGVLRKNAGPFSDEVDVAGDGRFIFTETDDSIVKTLDKLRVWGYGYASGTYRDSDSGGDDCTFQLASIPNGQCNSWGNPISEIYKETVRYIAGLPPETDFVADDTSFISGLTTATFDNPLTAENQCAPLNTILINASVSSYDDNDVDITGVAGGIDGTNTTAGANATETWTNFISDREPLTGDFFIGRTATDTDEFCTSKSIVNLFDALGLCPEAPTVLGSFAMAGIAYYAHNNDIRADLDGNQTLNTFAISLATNTPVITVPRTDDGQTVNILPAYRLVNNDGGGALVDFKIVAPHTRIPSTNQFAASYYVNWEDSEQGGDYDQDVWGIINYVLDEDADTITITTNVFNESTNQDQLFGFVTSGTTQDGFHAYSGIDGANYTDPTGVPGCTDCRALSEGGAGQRGPQSHTFTISANATQNLESPLFYAAKYGGFSENQTEETTPGFDPIDDSVPDELDEWDVVNNNTGDAIPDGLPDNYFFVIDPERLFDSLERSLQIILEQQERSNSSVANFTNANGFANIIVQAGYQELRTDDDLNEVIWTGTFNATFVDEFGYFREDSDGDGLLDGYGIDRAFEYVVNETTEETEIQYLTPRLESGARVFVNGILQLENDGGNVPLNNLEFLWSADEVLSSFDNNDIVNQRNYNASAGSSGASRYIFTHIDTDGNGNVDGGEQFDLTADLITPTNFQFFGVGSETVAEGVIDYVRGFDDPTSSAKRNRRLIDGADETVYRLGDIVNSTPAIVAQPTQNYDTVFGDTSYTAFRDLYEDRRTMVYVGGNDGFLHAFNAGFRSNPLVGTDAITVQYSESFGGATSHQLGAEVWAYAPKNLLPHLQWLSEPFYSHVFYVDGSPQIFEAKIFDDDADHPGGWGTILVVGMRLGGGDFPLILENGDMATTRSAYIVMDVTNPEEPPELLAEISHPDLNFTSAKPALYYDCDSACSSSTPRDQIFDGDWTLVFGSGPNDLRTFETSETAKIFTYDLRTRDTADLEVHEVEVGGDVVDDSFVGGIITKDWDNGENGFRDDDVLYFGTVGTLATADPAVDGADGDNRVETGALYRFRPKDNDSFSLLFDAERPIGSPPIALSNEALGPQDSNVLGSWVYFGTGIYQKQDDDFIADTERFYGILEPISQASLAALSSGNFDINREDSALLEYTEVTEGDLLDVTAINVLADGLGTLDPAVADANNAATFDELREYVVTSTNGWFRDLPQATIPGDPSSRLATEISSIQNFVLFTTFMPSSLNREDICIGGDGESDLFFVSQTTGTATGFGSLGLEGTSTDIAAPSLSLGSGFASSPVLFTSESIGGDGVVPIIRVDNGTTRRITRDDQDVDGDGDDDDVSLRTGNATITRSGWRELN